MFLNFKHFILRLFHINQIEKELEICKRQLLELKVITYSDKYSQEASYIKNNGLCVFPYKKLKSVGEINAGIDDITGLPFVIHNGNRLFFPQSYSIEKCINTYRRYIEDECLLGGGFLEKAPHQYQSSSFFIEDGDVLIDLGCAEALLSLHNINKVSKLILIESNPEWIPALENTFRSYKDKVIIINKFVSEEDSDDSITLKTILQSEKDNSLFIKMDIEGSEVEVLNSSKTFLIDCPRVKLACCTYHKHGDSDQIKNIFVEMGLNYEFSDGYMLFTEDNALKPPYFRKGVIRGWK